MSTRSRSRARRRRRRSVPIAEPVPSRTPVRTLRPRIAVTFPRRLRLRLGLRLRRSGRRALGLRLRLGLGGRALRLCRCAQLAEAALEVVEDEPDRRLRRRRRCDQRLAVADDEDAAALERDLELCELSARVAGLPRVEELARLPSDLAGARLVAQGRAEDFPAPVEDHGLA